ncbi:nucleotidyltransferase family protein [Thermofilum pendens]|uniref:nucleotidyltransferase family protein n=1 Tax=Thermofilum pendens TaxID=2269 RepID=UPI001FE0707F|nr:nucleotidyltransferase domain-containing protein [Thermofilum pendens]
MEMCLDDVWSGLINACKELRRVFGDEFVGLMLFGSFARCEAGERSDVDVFVVFKTLRGFEVRARAYKAIAKHVDKPLTLVTTTVDVLTSGDWTSLMVNIGYDGVVACDYDGSLHRFKERVLGIIRELDLVRYRTSDGKYGWMRRDGKPIMQPGLSGVQPSERA